MMSEDEINDRIFKINKTIRNILKEGGLKGSEEYEKLYQEREILQSILK